MSSVVQALEELAEYLRTQDAPNRWLAALERAIEAREHLRTGKLIYEVGEQDVDLAGGTIGHA